MRIEEYLAACGATDIKEVRPFLLQFRLPGDNHPAGRVTTTRDGIARIWHRGARDGLDLSDRWQPAAPVELEQGRSVPSYTARLADLRTGDKIAKRDLERLVAPDEEVKAAALSLLESYGWKQVGKGKAGLLYLNDGNGSTPACRMSVKDGIASVWSFRGDLDLPAPWRPGRTLKTGEKTMFATGRDLGVAASRAATRPSVLLPPPPSRPPVDKDLAAKVVDWWRHGEAAPEDHRHLTKNGARLVGDDLRLMPWESGFRGDLIVPMFRPPEGAKVALEVAGGQRLCNETVMGTDKMLLPGTRLADSFVPVPFSPLMSRVNDGMVNFEHWMKALGPGVKDRPLVVCEGVATALAIYESGAGFPVAAISSNNLEGVAKWLSESGYAARFSGFVIAADYDVGIKNGKPSSKAIERAIVAAEKVSAKIAIPPPGSGIGTDARDLYAQGASAVRDYIASAQSPEAARARPDIARLLNTKETGLER
jgi:hypothetical protein